MNKFRNFLDGFFGLLISVLAITNLFIYSKPYFDNGSDYSELTDQSILVILSMLIITALIFLVFRYLKNSLKIVMIFIIISIFTKAVWLYSFPLEYYYDMTSVFSFASDIYTIPDFLPIEGFHYLKVYDYNIPIVLLDLFYYNIAGLNNAWTLARVVNLFLLALIDFGIYMCALELFDKKTAIRGLLLSVLFFPFTGFVAVIYNDVISAVLFLYSVYFFIRYTKKFRVFDFMISIILLVIGNTFRSIGIIVLIAFTLYLLTIKWKKSIIYLVVCILAITINSYGLNQLYYNMGILDSTEESMRVPVSHYLAIGSSKGNNDVTPGYYSPYLNEYYFSVEEYDSQEFEEISLSNLNNNLSDLGLKGGISHYFSKYLLQWTDGTFETALINDFITNKDDSPITFDYKSHIYYLIAENELVSNLLIIYSNAYWLMILISIMFLSYKVKDSRLLILKLFIMGIMAFYILWEISPHYSFATLPYFIILAAKGLGYIYDLINNKI